MSNRLTTRQKDLYQLLTAKKANNTSNNKDKINSTTDERFMNSLVSQLYEMKT